MRFHEKNMEIVWEAWINLKKNCEILFLLIHEFSKKCLPRSVGLATSQKRPRADPLKRDT